VSQFVRRAVLEALETFPSPFRRILSQRGRVFDIKPSEDLLEYRTTALAEPEIFLLSYEPSLIEQHSVEDAKALMAQELDHLLRSEDGFPGGKYFSEEVPIPEILRRAVTEGKLDPVTASYIRKYYVRQNWPVEITGLAAEQAAKKGEGLARGLTEPRGNGLRPGPYKEAMKARREQARAVKRRAKGGDKEDGMSMLQEGTKQLR